MAPCLEAVGPSQRHALFRKLLAAETTQRQALGEEPKAADYLTQYPLFSTIIEELLPERSDSIDPGHGADLCLTETATCPGPTPETAPERPPRVPGYELIRLLGQGGMGVVYEGLHKATQRRVAIKMVVPAPTANETQARLFLREATTLSKLDHKRIVKFHEVGIVGGQLYLVMEYVDTIDLDDILEPRDDPRSVRLSCGFICQVLERWTTRMVWVSSIAT